MLIKIIFFQKLRELLERDHRLHNERELHQWTQDDHENGDQDRRQPTKVVGERVLRTPLAILPKLRAAPAKDCQTGQRPDQFGAALRPEDIRQRNDVRLPEVLPLHLVSANASNRVFSNSSSSYRVFSN